MACGRTRDWPVIWGGWGNRIIGLSTVARSNHHYTSPRTTDFLRAAPAYGIIQLSVHGRGDLRQLHNNYLFLSRQDSLNGLAIATLPLTADLVVLAACTTASGFSSRGEGTFSLRRSFQLAGVPDVISSLYNIPAAATSSVLDQFYTHLFQGQTVVAALSQAQRDCRAGRLSKRYVHPRYWSGLIVG